MNPLKAKPQPQAIAYAKEELINRCAELNQTEFAKKYDRWYYVEPANAERPATILFVDGITGEEVWKSLEGWRPDYVGWDEERTEKLTRRLRWLVKRGGARIN